MPDKYARLGTDLRLLRNLEEQNNRNDGSDLSVVRRAQTQRMDLETLTGVENFQQALLLRFLTPVGELAALGHSDYGSRLFELIGELNSQTNRNRAKMYVLQALAAEPRVKKVQSVAVTQSKKDPAEMDIDVWLLAIDSDTPTNLFFSFSL